MGDFPKGPAETPEDGPAIAAAHGTAQVLRMIDKLHELALAGDVQAAKVYLDRVVGPCRPDDDERRFADLVDDRVQQLILDVRARRAERNRSEVTAGDESSHLGTVDAPEPTSGGAAPAA
jgi:hypothetical protein